MSNVIELSTSTEVDDLVNDESYVVVDFFATWCQPCKMVAPILDKASIEYSDVKFVKVDVERAKDLAQRYNVRGVPTILFFKEGEVVATSVGLVSEAQLKSRCETLYQG